MSNCIPAQPGFELLRLHLSVKLVTRYTVIAWTLSDDCYLYPITTAGPELADREDDVWLVREPCGFVAELLTDGNGYDRHWSSLEGALDEFDLTLEDYEE